jgi:hypothetical protein
MLNAIITLCFKDVEEAEACFASIQHDIKSMGIEALVKNVPSKYIILEIADKLNVLDQTDVFLKDVCTPLYVNGTISYFCCYDVDTNSKGGGGS